jgi:hypothetical protein
MAPPYVKFHGFFSRRTPYYRKVFMPSRIVCFRMPESLDEAVCTLSDEWQIPLSCIMRGAVEYLVRHPALAPEIIGAHLPHATEDMRLPAQQMAWERDKATLEALVLEAAAAVRRVKRWRLHRDQNGLYCTIQVSPIYFE